MLKSFMIIAGLAVAMPPTDGKKILTEVLDRYMGAKSLELEYSINRSDNKAAEKCAYYTNGHDHYSEAGDRVSLRNGEYFIVVTKSKREIIVTDARTQNEKGPHQFAVMKDQLKDCKVNIVHGKGFTGIQLHSDKALIKDVLYEIKDGENLLQKVQYAHQLPNDKKPVTTTVHYNKTVFDRKYDRDFFSEKKIVKRAGKKFEASETYKGYTVIDLTKRS